MTTVPDCPVILEFLGIPFDCTEPVTTRITTACDHGCERDPIRVCDYHAQVISRDDPNAICSVCDKAGRPESRIHLVSATPIDLHATTEAP